MSVKWNVSEPDTQEALSTTFVINSILHFFLRLEVDWTGVDKIRLENNLLDLSNSDIQDFEQWLDLQIFWTVFSVHLSFHFIGHKIIGDIYIYIYSIYIWVIYIYGWYIYIIHSIMYMSINT